MLTVILYSISILTNICPVTYQSYENTGCCYGDLSGVPEFVCSTSRDLYQAECCENSSPTVQGHVLLQDFTAFRFIGDHLTKYDQYVSYSSNGNTLILAANTAPAGYSLVKVTQMSLQFLSSVRNMNSLNDAPPAMLHRNTHGDVTSLKLLCNALTLIVRTDVLNTHGIAVPTTYDTLFDALEKLREHGYKTPYSFPSKNGWNGAYEMVAAYSSLRNGVLDGPIDTSALKSAIDIFRRMLSYSYLPGESSSSTVQYAMSSGESVISHVWASRVKPIIDVHGENITIYPSLRAQSGGTPHNFFWWDGLSLVSDNSAAVDALRPLTKSTIYENVKDMAAWLGYTGKDVPSQVSVIRTIRSDPHLLEYVGSATTLHNIFIQFSSQFSNSSIDSTTLANLVAAAQS